MVDLGAELRAMERIAAELLVLDVESRRRAMLWAFDALLSAPSTMNPPLNQNSSEEK